MTTPNIYVPNEGAISDMAGWLAGDLGPAYARLYVSNTPFLRTRVCADYTEASFPGYVPVNPMGWGVPFINGAGKAEVDSAALVWTLSSLIGSYFAYGIYVTDVAKTKLLMVLPFLSPYEFTPAFNSLAYIVQATEVSEL
jgi:hypothetical protein